MGNWKIENIRWKMMTPKRGINNASDPQSKQGKRRSYNSLGHTEGAGEWSKQTN